MHEPAAPAPLVMMRGFGFLLQRRAAQKISFFVFFLAISGPFRIITFHLQALVGRELGKMTNKTDQFPAVFLRSVSSAESGHAGKAHAVLDNPEELAIRKFLRLRGTHIHRLGIETL